MKNLSRIAVAIDLSDSSGATLREAVRISKETQAHLTIVHVVDSRVLEALEDRIQVDETGLLRETHKRVDRFVESLVGELNDFNIMLRVGHPFEEIVRLVNEARYDLLVMGAQGSQNEPNRVGPIASKCVRKAPVDVLLVQPSHVGPHARMMACVDFSDSSRKAAEGAVALAVREQAALEFLHVYQPIAEFVAGSEYLNLATPYISDEELMSDLKEKLDGFVAPLIEGQPNLKSTTKVICNRSIARGIIEEVNATDCGLLILSTRGRTGFKMLLLGTTAEKVIHHCECSTLAVKPVI